MLVLVLDNYDSFTYNLVQYLGELGAEPLVIRNDKMTPEEADELPFERLVVSRRARERPKTPVTPSSSSNGSGRGSRRWVSAWAIRRSPSRTAARSTSLPNPGTARPRSVRHDGRGIFAGLENPFTATRYHSLAAITLPDELEPCAWSEDGVIQGIRHLTDPVVGVQFHPESVMTTEGKKLLANFLRWTSR